MSEAIKNVEIQNVYEEKPGQWVALMRHVGEDYTCGGAGDSAEVAVQRGFSGVVSMLKARGFV